MVQNTAAIQKYRIDFKILVFVFKVLNGLCPQYITDLLTPYSAPRSLKSSSQRLLSVPHSCLKTKGDQAFSVAAPTLWNNLPSHIKSCSTINNFKSNLKTHLFSLAFSSVVCCPMTFVKPTLNVFLMSSYCVLFGCWFYLNFLLPCPVRTMCL